MMSLIPTKSQMLLNSLLIFSPILVAVAVTNIDKFNLFYGKLTDEIGKLTDAISNVCSSAYSIVTDWIKKLIHFINTKARSMYSKMPNSCDTMAVFIVFYCLGALEAPPLLMVAYIRTPKMIHEMIRLTQEHPNLHLSMPSLSDIPAIAAAASTIFYLGFIKRKFLPAIESITMIYNTNQNYGGGKHYARTLLQSGLTLLGMSLMHNPSVIVPALLATSLDLKSNFDRDGAKTDAFIKGIEDSLDSIFRPAH